MSIKYNTETIKYRTAFENLTGVRVRDCFLDDKLFVIVEHGELGKAVGKHGSNVKRLENLFKKKLKIIEFDENLAKFVANIIWPVKATNINVNDKEIIISANGVKEKGILIGRDRKNINELKKIVSMYFDVAEIKIN